MHKPNKGFSLIELMITVAIVGILASIAFPSYQEYVARSKRADAQGALLSLANAMERYFTENNTYCGSDNDGTAGTCVADDLPGIFASQVPVDGGTAYYNLTITASEGPNAYTLTATGTASMSSDKCGAFVLSNTGAQTISGADTGITTADCWK